jgi:hypothetical protein
MILVVLSREVFEDALVLLFGNVVIGALSAREANLTFSHSRERVLDRKGFIALNN